MTWKIFPIDTFLEFSGNWDSIQSSGKKIPFLESAFLHPLLNEFGTGEELLAFESEGGRFRAGAILSKMAPGVWQTFQPSQLPLGAYVSAQSDSIEACENLVKALPGFGLILGLTQLDPIVQTRPQDYGTLQSLDYINTAWVDIDRTFDDYWAARGKNLRSNLKKQRSKLEAEGIAPVLECVTKEQDVAQAISDYGTLESLGWKAKDGTAVHPENAQGRFYRRMLESFCAVGRGRIYRYWFGDKVVAMDLCIEVEDRIVILKTSYDESYKSISPSTLMRQDEFQQLFEQGQIKRIEFYGKIMEWHTRWTENSRTLFHVTRYRWSFLQSLHRKLKHRRSTSEVSET